MILSTLLAWLTEKAPQFSEETKKYLLYKSQGGEGRNSHLNNINKFFNRFMFMCPGLLKMLKWLRSGADNQPLQQQQKGRKGKF